MEPLLVIYRPQEIPSPQEYLGYWRDRACQEGLDGLYIIGDGSPLNIKELGLDACMYSGQRYIPKDAWDDAGPIDKLMGRQLKKMPYRKALKYLSKESYDEWEIPIAIPNWDTTPRLNQEAMIFYQNDPHLFGLHLRQIHEATKNSKGDNKNLLFLRSWNEWAEGNYVEPDMEFGLGYLQAILDFINSSN